MNIDQFRELKAKEQEDSSNKGEQPDAQAESTTTQTETSEEKGDAQAQSTSKPEDSGTEDKQTEKQTNDDVTEKIEIDGKAFTVDEIKEMQQGYMRQQDYTKKTQDLAEQRKQIQESEKFIEALKQNPEQMQQLSESGQIQENPGNDKVKQMERELNDLKLDRDIRDLKDRYTEFDETSVLQYAYDNHIPKLEDAFLMWRGEKTPETPDKESLKEELRKEVLQEIKKENEENDESTRSMITTPSSNQEIKDDKPQLTAQQRRVAQNFSMSDEEYAKWLKAK